MPTYQYACKDCGHQFDAVQSFTDDSLTDCPQCSGRLRKVYGSVGVVFKGSGFYRTDSRSGSSVPSANGSNGSGDKSSDKAASSSEKASSSAGSGSSDSGSSSASGSSSSGSSSAGSSSGTTTTKAS